MRYSTVRIDDAGTIGAKFEPVIRALQPIAVEQLTTREWRKTVRTNPRQRGDVAMFPAKKDDLFISNRPAERLSANFLSPGSRVPEIPKKTGRHGGNGYLGHIRRPRR